MASLAQIAAWTAAEAAAFGNPSSRLRDAAFRYSSARPRLTSADM